MCALLPVTLLFPVTASSSQLSGRKGQSVKQLLHSAITIFLLAMLLCSRLQTIHYNIHFHCFHYHLFFGALGPLEEGFQFCRNISMKIASNIKEPPVEALLDWETAGIGGRGSTVE